MTCYFVVWEDWGFHLTSDLSLYGQGPLSECPLCHSCLVVATRPSAASFLPASTRGSTRRRDPRQPLMFIYVNS